MRVNTLLTTMDEVINAFLDDGWNLLPKCETYADYLDTITHLTDYNFIKDFHIPELLAFPSNTKFFNHRGYLNRKLILQDKVKFLIYKKKITI